MPRGTRIFGPVAQENSGKGIHAHSLPGAGGGVMNIRAGDQVLVIAGKEKGKTGRVDRQIISENRVVVEGVNMITRHLKPRPGLRQAGRIQMEAPIHMSNVMLICNKCNQTTRPTSVTLETGQRVRGCPKCKEVIDDAR